MAAVKAKKTTSKLKAGQKKRVNVWVILSGVAAIAVIGVLVVRYSGASSNVWSIRSAAVASKGGTVKYKDNGAAYWIGTKRGEYVSFTAPTSGTYCMEGKYLTENMAISWDYGNTGGAGAVSSPTDFSSCRSIGKGQKYTIRLESNGTMVFNRVRKK